MSTKKIICAALVIACLSARAAQVLEGDFPSITIGTNSYTNAHIRAYSLTEGTLRHSGGFQKIKLCDLPEPLRSRFYSPALIEKSEKEKAARLEAARQAAGKVRAVVAAKEAAEIESLRPLTPQDQKELTVELRPGSQVLQVKNLDKRRWPEINIYINGDPPFAYGITLPSLKPGQAVKIPLNQFTKSDGRRFDPSAYALTKVWVGGHGFDYCSYGF